MKAILEQARYLFLESTGWTHLDTRGRWVAVYFALSLTAIGILKEAPVWVWIAVALNFMNAARMVRTIDMPELTDGDGEEESPSNENKHNNNDRPGDQPPTQRTTWLSIYWYGEGGAVLPYLKRGAKVFVRGTMRNNLYTDRTGQTRVDINVNAREVYLCGGTPAQTQATQPAATQHVAGQISPAGAPAPIGGEDDLPF